jgi:hypothetical protein
MSENVDAEKGIQKTNKQKYTWKGKHEFFVEE